MMRVYSEALLLSLVVLTGKISGLELGQGLGFRIQGLGCAA